MSTLISPGLPLGMLDFQAELCAGWVSAVSGHLAPLGIVTVEIWYPQTGADEVRPYKKSELPALWCRAKLESIKGGCAGYLALEYAIHWGVAVENATLMTGRATLEQIRENVAALFGSSHMQGSTSFLASGYQVVWGDTSLGDPTRPEKMQYMVIGLNETRVTVTYSSPPEV